MKKLLVVLFCFFLCSLYFASPVFSQKPEEGMDFFRGKVMTMIVATNPGGSYDQYGRMIAKFIEKKLGATVVVKNVPGEGMIIGANEIYKAPPDGLTFGTFNIGLLVAQLREEKEVQFDLKKFTWLGNASAMTRFLAVRAALPYKNLEDIKKLKQPLKIPSSGVGSSAHNDILMIKKILGLNLEVIPGYGGAETDKALLSGEMDGRMGSSASLIPSFQKGFLRPFLIVAEKRDPAYSDVPTLSEVAPKEMQPMVNLMVAMCEIARPFATSPGISEGRKKALQQAFEEAFSDKDFLEIAKKTKMPLTYFNPVQVQKMVNDALIQSPEVISFLKTMVREE